MDTGRLRSEALRRVRDAAVRYRFALLVLAVGVVLLLLPDGRKKPDGEESKEPFAFDQEALRAEMEQILSAVDGTGRLSLMLSFEAGCEQELARDTSESGEGSGIDGFTRRSETVVLGTGTSAQVVVTRQVYPRCTGALVVCEGGGDAAVRLELTRAVAALTGLSSDRISVVRGSPRETGR